MTTKFEGSFVVAGGVHLSCNMGDLEEAQGSGCGRAAQVTDAGSSSKDFIEDLIVEFLRKSCETFAET